METAITIDIFPTDVRVFFLFQAEDYERFSIVWESEDTVLEALAQQDIFAGVKTWGDLSPIQLRFLIIQTLNRLCKENLDYIDETDDEMMKLRFFVGSLAMKYHKLTGDYIELLKIHYLSENKANFEVFSITTLSVDVIDDNIELPASSALKLVVDNSKKKK